jgi:hypothetical protein
MASLIHSGLVPELGLSSVVAGWENEGGKDQAAPLLNGRAADLNRLAP